MEIYLVSINSITEMVIEDREKALKFSVERIEENYTDKIVIERWYDGKLGSMENIDGEYLKDLIFIGVAEGDNQLRYEDHDIAEENVAVGIKKLDVIEKLNQCKTLPNNGYEVTARYIETWRRNERINREAI